MLFPSHEWLKRHQTKKLTKELMISQWTSLDKLRVIQSEKLYGFLKTVMKDVPFYKSYQHHLPTCHHDALSCLSQLPIIDKSDITKHFNELKSQKLRDCVMRKTGGSSGEPFEFLLSKRRISHDVAAKWRATKWWGVDIGDKELVIWGSQIEFQGQSLLKKIRDFALRSHFVSSEGLNSTKINQILKLIVTMRPKMLFSYPSILNVLANAQKESLNNSYWQNLKVAFVTSEMLEPFQKANIESAFGCKVANGYGGRDLGFIAHACMEGNLHLSFEDIVVEILDPKGRKCAPGMVGEIVVTHLSTQDFPFIRYRSGDYGSISYKPCACGRGLPILDKLDGRVSDLIYAKDSSIIHRSQLFKLISRYSSKITNFRFEQYSLEHAQLLYIGSGLSLDQLCQMEASFLSLLGSDVKLDIIHCQQMPELSSGKHKFIISHLAVNPPHKVRATA